MVFQGVTVLTAVGALLFTALSLNATRDQLHLSEQGQITDRFSKAIDQLGQEDAGGQNKLSIRLGGVYALERIMRDSPDDEPAVIEVLCAFIRTHASGAPAWPNSLNTSESNPSARVPARPAATSAPDVQAAFFAVALRPNPAIGRNSRLDLTSAHVSLPPNVDLTHAYLAGAYLGSAYLAGANLAGANLAGANLAGAYLAGANLVGANLTDATLTDTDLGHADLTHANLTHAYLVEANLVSAYLARANLARANLARANLAGADLAGANLGNADLAGSIGVLPQQLADAHLNGGTRLPADVDQPTPSLSPGG